MSEVKIDLDKLRLDRSNLSQLTTELGNVGARLHSRGCVLDSAVVKAALTILLEAIPPVVAEVVKAKRGRKPKPPADGAADPGGGAK